MSQARRSSEMQAVASDQSTQPSPSKSKHVTIDVPEATIQPPPNLSPSGDGGPKTRGAAPPNVYEASPASTPGRFPPEHIRRPTEEKLLGIPNHQPQYSGTRTYNYEEKYPPDELGKESGPEARVWRMYLDEAESYDDDMLRSFRDTIDSSLVLAALFAAIVATLLAQTSLSLKPDYGKLTVMLLVEQGKLLRAAGNQTMINEIIQASNNVNEETPTLTNNDIWVNGLFFSSLALTLATALFSVLVKQWLQAYMALSSGSAMDRALIRQFRFDGLKKWKLSTIVNTLPLLLHTAFAVFLAGLSLFVHDLRPSLSWVVVAITALSFGAYLGSVVLPAVWLECPYRIPLLFRLARAALWIPTFMSYSILRIWAALTQSPGPPIPTVTIPSLRAAEKEHLRPISELASQQSWTKRDTILCRCLLWMHALSSNKSIHRVATQALHGILSSEYMGHDMNSSAWEIHYSQILRCRALFDKLPISQFLSVAWDSYVDDDDPEAPSSFTHLWIRLLRMLRAASSRLEFFALDTPSPEACTKHLLRACVVGRVNFARTMLKWGANVNAVNSSGEPLLYTASLLGHLDLVKLLLDTGAHLRAVTGLFGTALQAASAKGHLGIARFLIEKGADLDVVDGLYGTALQAASLMSHLDIVKLLVDAGADLDIEGGEYGTALKAACSRGHLEIVRFLVEQGADLDIVGGDYGTALQAASCWGHLEIVKLLVEKGADIDITGGQYGSALGAALVSKHSNHAVIKFLRDSGAKGPA